MEWVSLVASLVTLIVKIDQNKMDNIYHLREVIDKNYDHLFCVIGAHDHDKSN